jgi:hypothetical protein
MSIGLAAAALGLGQSAVVAGTAATSALVAGVPLAASGLSALGTLSQSRAASQAASYNAQVATQNAQIATTNANMTGAQGEAAVGVAGAKTRAAAAGELANQGASGLDVNKGSAVDVRASTAEVGELNALTIRSQAAQTAYGYQTQAAGYQGTAALDKFESTADQEGGELKGASTLLGTVANPNYNYLNFLDSGSSIPYGSSVLANAASTAQ